MSPAPKSPAPKAVVNTNGTTIYFEGPALDEGTAPSLIYFALSGQASLYEDPYNQPVLKLAKSGIRTFSWDLPFHDHGSDYRTAMSHWASEYARNPDFLSNFMKICQNNLDFLIQENFVDPSRLAIAGLSRGAFMATHLAALDPRLSIILGFAPLTQPQPIEEFAHLPTHVGLSQIAPELIHKQLRYYIGNHDTRVGTDTCFNFVHTLSQTAYNLGVRSPQVELNMYPSIGFKGHGTPPEIFLDGAEWIKLKLVG